MKSAIEEIQLFRVEQAARLIGGDEESNLIVMKARASEARSAALTWINTIYRPVAGEELNTMATSDVCPLLDPKNRGSLLFPAAVDDLLHRIDGAASHEERWGWIQQLRRHDFRKLQFHRSEIARWLEACELKSEYAFSALTLPRGDSSELKRAALVTKLSGQWPTIDRDLRDSGQNGLKAAGSVGRHGFWNEANALAWARQRGKLMDASIENVPANSVFSQVGKVHRI